jgi:hypothetical protein
MLSPWVRSFGFNPTSHRGNASLYLRPRDVLESQVQQSHFAEMRLCGDGEMPTLHPNQSIPANSSINNDNYSPKPSSRVTSILQNPPRRRNRVLIGPATCI